LPEALGLAGDLTAYARRDNSLVIRTINSKLVYNRIDLTKLSVLKSPYTLRQRLPKLYSRDLLNNLFRHPYTRIDFLMEDLHVTRLTVTRYLKLLTEQGFVHKQKIGRSNYYINQPLMKLFGEVGHTQPAAPTPLIRTTSEL